MPGPGRGKKAGARKPDTPVDSSPSRAGAMPANDDGAESSRPAALHPGSSNTTVRGIYSAISATDGGDTITMGGKRQDWPTATAYTNPHITPFDHWYDDVFAPCVLTHLRSHTKRFPTPSDVYEALLVYLDKTNPDIHAAIREASEEAEESFMPEINAIGEIADKKERKANEGELIEQLDAKALDLLKVKLRHTATKDILETLMDESKRDSITEVPSTFVRRFK